MIEQTIEFKYKKGQMVKLDGRDYVILNFWKSGPGQNVYELEGKSDCVVESALEDLSKTLRTDSSHYETNEGKLSY